MCPSENNCTQCFVQPDRPGLPLLQRVDQQPVDSVALNALGTCFPVTGDTLSTCSDLCASLGCGSFFVRPSAGECCLQSSFSTDLGYLERPGGFFYSRRQCSACQSGCVPIPVLAVADPHPSLADHAALHRLPSRSVPRLRACPATPHRLHLPGAYADAYSRTSGTPCIGENVSAPSPPPPLTLGWAMSCPATVRPWWTTQSLPPLPCRRARRCSSSRRHLT